MRTMLDVLANYSKGYLVGGCDVEEEKGRKNFFFDVERN